MSKRKTIMMYASVIKYALKNGYSVVKVKRLENATVEEIQSAYKLVEQGAV